MKRAIHYFCVFAAFCLTACGNKPSSEGTAEKSAWLMSNYPVARVDVSTPTGTLLESFEYTYDDLGRMASLTRKDCQRNRVLLKLDYTYPSATEMRIRGTYAPVSGERTLIATADPAKGTISYSGAWKDAWRYDVTRDPEGVLTGVTMQRDFKSKEGYYSSETSYREMCSVRGGCIETWTSATEVSSKSRKTSSSKSSSAVNRTYTYLDHEDTMNFGLYLTDGEFPVWAAAQLPGCSKLISGMTMKTGSVSGPVSFKVDYTFNIDGDVETATRTDYNGTSPVLVRVYTVTYL